MTDLGIDFSADLKPSVQCLKAAAKAHKMLSIIKLAFKFLDTCTITIMYKAFVRPLLEYCCVVRCPYYIKDIEVLEKVQRRFTRILSVFCHLLYDSRFTKYKLESLYARRLSHNLITVYKIVHGLPNVKFSLFLVYVMTLAHVVILMRYSLPILDWTKQWFSCRVVPLWNSLPSSCVEAPTVDLFKNELHNHFPQFGYIDFSFCSCVL